MPEPADPALTRHRVPRFLFVFNGAVAAFCAVSPDGTQVILAAADMGVVSLGAGLGLLPKRGGKPRPEQA